MPQFSIAERGTSSASSSDSTGEFVRGLAFGTAAAIVGLMFYVGVALATGLVIGYVSLAVGFMVGKAMIYGSRGVGGRRYQLAAAVLTYLAVSLSALPIAMHQSREHPVTLQPSHSTAIWTIPKALGVVVLGIASPFLALQDPIHGFIGLIILAVGIRFAWRSTASRAPPVSGLNTPTAAGAI